MRDCRWIGIGALVAMGVGLVPSTVRAEPGQNWTVDSTPQWEKARAAGRGFKFELKIEDTTDNRSKPILDRVALTFE